jgi:hypothetical protein
LINALNRLKSQKALETARLNIKTTKKQKKKKKLGGEGVEKEHGKTNKEHLGNAGKPTSWNRTIKFRQQALRARSLKNHIVFQMEQRGFNFPP